MTNKKERFTPGPWHNSFENIIHSPTGNTIACGIWAKDTGECCSNARLISAAPEMLEALQLVVEKLSDRVFKMNVKNSFSEKLAMEAARSAIRKALGE